MFTRCLAVLITLCGMMGLAFADSGVAITHMTARPRYPWNGKIDIVVELEGDTNVIADTECLFVATNAETRASVRVFSIQPVGSDVFVENGCTRGYLWDAEADMGAVNVDDLALSVRPQRKMPGVQLWENGPYWAECNLGAQKPEDAGYYFLWGDTVGYKMKSGTWSAKYALYDNVTWESSTGEVMSTTPFREDAPCDTMRKREDALVEAGCLTSGDELMPAYDAATVQLGAPWVMPHYGDVKNVATYCTHTWMTSNGVCGVRITGVGDYAAQSIFLPAVGYAQSGTLYRPGAYGYYWSSSVYASSSYDYALSLFSNSEKSGWTNSRRWYGLQIRPVRRGALDQGTNVTTHLKVDCRAGLRIPSVHGDVLSYDAAWFKNASRVRITDNGTVVANGVSGTWVWNWSEDSAAIHILKLEALSEDGAIVASETARFGMAYRIAAARAQPRYPWNGKVDIVVELEGDTNTLALTACTFAATNRENASAVAVSAVGLVGRPVFYDNGCTRHYLWDAAADIGDEKLDDLALSVDVKLLGVQLWKDGPCWAECNLGASTPEDAGYYFWWGDTVGYKPQGGTWGDTHVNLDDVTWVSSAGAVLATSPFRGSACVTYQKTYKELNSEGFVDAGYNLTAAYDAALVHLGTPWHMPTKSEMSALKTNCTNVWTTCNGVYGCRISGKGKYASRSIFFPAAGYGDSSGISYAGSRGFCWSSTLYSYPCDTILGTDLNFRSNHVEVSNTGAYHGVPVRPIRNALPLLANDDAITQIRTGLTVDLSVDCRSGVRALAVLGDVLYYDASWYENGEEVRITDNGVVVTNDVSGSCRWFPDLFQSEHVLKLQVLSHGEVVDEETVSFSIGDGIRVGDAIALAYSPAAEGEDVQIYCDGACVLSDVAAGDWPYEPLSIGAHLLQKVSGTNEWSVWVDVTDTHYDMQALAEEQARDAAIEPAELAVDFHGGTNAVTWDVDAAVAWRAWVTNQWLSVSPVAGVGSGPVTVRVAPYREVGIRQGAVFVGGKSISVTQRGVDMALGVDAIPCTDQAQSVVVDVAALEDVAWAVAPHADWIAVVQAGAGQGPASVELSVARNDSYLPRTGTVTIGTETLTLTQDGCSGLAFDLSVSAVEVAATQTVGLCVQVMATPDLPWAVTCSNDWLTVSAGDLAGAGTADVVYSVAANPKLFPRTGTLVFTPTNASGKSARTLTIHQAAASATLNTNRAEITAAAQTIGVVVSADAIVEWAVVGAPDWMVLEGEVDRTGPHVLTFQVAANPLIVARDVSIQIAGHAFVLWQEGRDPLPSDSLNAPDLTFVEDGTYPWLNERTVSHDGVAAMCSATVSHKQKSTLTTTVIGAGELSFWCKVSSEADPDDGEAYDGLALTVDGADALGGLMGGEVDWTNVTVTISGGGVHTICWCYKKDKSGTEGADCAWLDEVTWTPASPLPDLGESPTLDMITNVLGKAEDARLPAKITNAADYVAFRAWAGGVQPHGGGDPVGAAGVMAAPHAWVSYALGCATLLEAALTDADLTVEDFGPKPGEAGVFDFTVRVKDVEVGSEALAENLKQVFELEGGPTLEPGGLSSANVNLSFETPEDGKVKFTAGPKDTEAKTFFMRVKVKP